MNLTEFIDRADDMLRNWVEQWYSQREILFSRIAKLTEEVGELSGDVMLSLGHGRKEKVEQFDLENLWWEIADVIIVAHLIAKAYNIDVEDALNKKMEKIQKR